MALSGEPASVAAMGGSRPQPRPRPVQPISFKRHRFPPEVIRYAVWACFRFTMILRDVEDLSAERGIHVSYEAIRCWTTKFGRAIARNIRGVRQKPMGRWHFDEMSVKIGGERM